MDQEIINQISAGATLLTANQRLAQFLRQQVEQANHQASPGRVFVAPDILPLSSWVVRTWQEAVEQGLLEPQLLLNGSQEANLWQEIIKQQANVPELFDLKSTAKLAQSAWELIQQWEVPFIKDFFNVNQNTSAFYPWALEFERTKRKQNLICKNNIAKQLIDLYKNNKLECKPTLMLTGFDTLPKLYENLLNFYFKNESKPIEYYRKLSEKNILVYALNDTQAEINAMAYWAENLLKNNPNARIACIVPNLSALRSEIFKVFSKIFIPSAYLRNTYKDSLFNISAGLPFNQFPIIATALLILNLNQNKIKISEINNLLCSPFIGQSQEHFSQNALTDAKLRSLKLFDISINELANFLKVTHSYLSQLIDNITLLKNNAATLQQPSEWANFFSSQLQIMGWPGQRPLDSTEYQLVKRWTELLDEFSSLDWVSGNITLYSALQKITQLASETIFQAQSANSPIQILGMLEAAGLAFDHIWIMGLHDAVFPSIAAPNQFIPLNLQKKYNIPHSSAERELEFAKSLLERFLHTAPDIVFSYPLHEDDRDLRPSQLVQPFITESKFPSLPNKIEAAIFATSDIETLNDDHGPVFADGLVKGGTSLFKHQAQCPFRAFAALRLKALPSDEPILGISAIERGTLLHRIMHSIWQELSTQQRLNTFTELELHDFINRKIAQCLNSETKFTKKSKRILLLEQKALFGLVLTWLQYELQRPEFVVSSMEQKQLITIAGLELSVQIDRVDKLMNGDHIIIDYKTGTPSINDWFGERPDEPQLPIYYLSQNQMSIAGLAFAQIHPEKCTFKGVAQSDLEINGIKAISALSLENGSDWPQQIKHWQAVLTALAEEFKQGFAKVNPKQMEKTCQHCALHSLCRIHEKMN